MGMVGEVSQVVKVSRCPILVRFLWYLFICKQLETIWRHCPVYDFCEFFLDMSLAVDSVVWPF